jgi:Domain of unknown function (DUF6915)
MANAYHHAVSSARRFGGTPEAYQPIHDWLDASKMIIADFRHRALRHHAEGCFAAVMWTCKRGLILALMEVVVPVVHRRGPAVRVARISAQAERAAGRCLWTHRGEHRATRAVAISIYSLSKICEQLLDTAGDRAVPLDLARPGPLAGIVCK